MLRKNFVYILRLLAGKSGRICRVSPGNFFGKNFNNASFKISCHELFKQHLVQKKCRVNANYCLALSKKIIFVLRNSESTKSISSPEFFVHNWFLARDACKKVFNEKTPWQAKDSSETWSVIDSFFSFCFKFWLVIRPMACHDVFSE